MPSPGTFLPKKLDARRPLHIVSTSFLKDNEILVSFSDGSGAIFEAEELEKLRPVPKHTLPAPIGTGSVPAYADFR